MTDEPFLDPDDDDEEDDEAEADKDPVNVCRYCGADDCAGGCRVVLGYGAP